MTKYGHIIIISCISVQIYFLHYYVYIITFDTFKSDVSYYALELAMAWHPTFALFLFDVLSLLQVLAVEVSPFQPGADALPLLHVPPVACAPQLDAFGVPVLLAPSFAATAPRSASVLLAVYENHVRLINNRSSKKAVCFSSFGLWQEKSSSVYMLFELELHVMEIVHTKNQLSEQY